MGMMIIFRNNFSELIEIDTTASARQLPDTTCFDASVRVTVIRRQVTPGAGEDGYWMTLLKFITNNQEPSQWPYIPRPFPPVNVLPLQATDTVTEGIANLEL